MAIRHHPVVGHLTSAPVPLRKVAIEEASADLADRRGGGLRAARGAVDAWLPWSIDQQLQRDSDLGMVEYQVLAMLSNRSSADHADELAGRGHQRVAPGCRTWSNGSKSEAWCAASLIRPTGRSPTPSRPAQGFQTLAEAAPGHVAHVRSLVIDVLSPEQLRRLGLLADRIVSRIDTSGIN